MEKKRITLFQALEIFFDEVGARIGSPSPTFWKALRKIWLWVLAASATIGGLSEAELLAIPPTLVKVNNILIFVAASSLGQTYLAKKDPGQP